MPTLNPFVVGRWNGSALWIQCACTPEEMPDGLRMEINVRKTLEKPGKWLLLDGGRTRKSWRVVDCPRAGEIVEVRVAVNGVPDSTELAAEGRFLKSTCSFAVEAGAAPLNYPAGTKFVAVVDAAVCSYELPTPLDVRPNEIVHATMVAVTSTGFCQLDREGHFDLRPGNGVRIWNTAPSENDLEPTGRHYTVLEAMPMDGPLMMAKIPKSTVR